MDSLILFLDTQRSENLIEDFMFNYYSNPIDCKCSCSLFFSDRSETFVSNVGPRDLEAKVEYYFINGSRIKEEVEEELEDLL